MRIFRIVRRKNLPVCLNEKLSYALFADQKQVKIFEYSDFNHVFRDQHEKLVKIAHFKYRIFVIFSRDKFAKCEKSSNF